MAREVDEWEYDGGEYELGDKAWFKPPYSDTWHRGEIVRVYNTRTLYHISWRGKRYEVESHELARYDPDED